MSLDLDAFDRAIIKALNSDAEIILPQCVNSLKLLLGDKYQEFQFDHVYNELFILNLYSCIAAIGSCFKGHEEELVDRLNELVEENISKDLGEERACIMMAHINQRLLEHSKKLDIYIREGGSHKSQDELGQYLTSSILGDSYKKDFVISIQVLAIFSSMLKTFGDYFKGLETLIKRKAN